MVRKIFMVLCFFLLFVPVGMAAEETAEMSIRCPDFKNEEAIPERFTCQGENVNPAFIITGVPAHAKSLAFIVDDPDAPPGVWVHWVVYDISPFHQFAENSVPGKQGVNDFGEKSYRGPCPPRGTHRYFFKLYALDRVLDLDEGITKDELEQAMQGHIVAQAQLVGLYSRVH